MRDDRTVLTLLDTMTDRVARHFPVADHRHIYEIVHSEYDLLADKPIKLYIANLVEHNTRVRLRLESAGSRAAA